MRTTFGRRIGLLITTFLAALLALSPVEGAWLVGAAPALADRKLDPALSLSARSRGGISVIVREASPASDRAERLVRGLGGHVTRELPIIGGFAAEVPGTELGHLAASSTVSSVSGDRLVRVSSITDKLNRQDANTVWQQVIGLDRIQGAGYNGSGVTVALVDTGVVEVPDLSGRIVAKVDFTHDRDGIDYFGHGTHMAGIIAGNGAMSKGTWTGVAPKAKIVSVKVAGADGSTDVSVVIAGMQWVYAHRAEYGIKVLNLSFGTDSQQSYLVDPLDYAVEQLWRSGVFVSAAAGNRGPADLTINKPGDDPFIQTVGAADLKNTTTASDDALAIFSSRGLTPDGFLKPEVVAPGVTIVSLRAPGSSIDQAYPSARVGTNYFKGTGTSQAAAILSGIAALMIQARPGLTPDVAKATVTNTATARSGRYGVGIGLVNARTAVTKAASGAFTASPANVGLVPSTGTGSLDASRGSTRVYTDLPFDGLGAEDLDGQADQVTGEIDALGNAWSNLGWSTVGETGFLNLGWSNLGWSASVWSNLGWSGIGWSDPAWSGTFWTNVGWENVGWENVGWENVGWENLGWDSVGWETPIALSLGWGRR